MTPDVNVLVAAFREEHPHHAAARAWLIATLADCRNGGSLELLPMVAAGFVRVATHRKAFRLPVQASAALGFIRGILAVPGTTMLASGNEWNAFEKLCIDRQLTGNQVPDAWIAAAVKAHGLRLVTFDTDFAALLEPAECLLLESRPSVQEKRGNYVVRRMPRATATPP